MAPGLMQRLMENISVRLDSKVHETAVVDGTETTTTTYVAEALPGTALATAKWRVKRIVEVADTATGITVTTTTYAGGSAEFQNAATDLPGLYA